MGTYLSTPVLDKCWEEGEDLDHNTPVAWGVVDMQGWRKSMEDAHIAQTDVRPPQHQARGNTAGGAENDSNNNNPEYAQVFAVFDGHGGAEVARFCQLYLIDVLTRQEEWNGSAESTEIDVGKALVNCFHSLDELLDDPRRREEINYLRTNKPNFAERRAIIDLPEESSSEEENEDEEKKMEESNLSDTPMTVEDNNSTESTIQVKDTDSEDSAASDEKVVGDVHEVVSVDDSGGDNDTEDETTIDIAGADSLSLFKKLLTMTNKAGAPSGTMTLNLGTPVNDAEEGENKIITPTILQNGRPVCNLPDHPIHAGCTSVCAVISGKTLTVANAGDSRVVLCRADGVTEPMSFDHKPMHDIEMQRITDAGGFVNQFGRVNGNLNLSRSIGDLKYKQVPNIPPCGQMITAEPDIKQIELRDDDEFIILACDGIWDCLTNEEAVKYVRDRIDRSTPTEIGVEMLDQIVSKDPRETQGIGGDNMTIMIVDLMPMKRPYRNGSSTESEAAKEE
mmetsp:Transcript_14604/g.22116  ORF Transcript_14604/g.22116 Transcript_14604/m.22116 type:complete len:507 (+) Transcript_14604:132-1652(+)